jgi:hypothetical protein
MNVTRKRPARDKLSAEVRAAIESANQLDLELYRYAESLFHEQVVRQGENFPNEVKAFQRNNRRRYFLYYLAWRTRERSILTYRSLLKRLGPMVSST